MTTKGRGASRMHPAIGSAMTLALFQRALFATQSNAVQYSAVPVREGRARLTRAPHPQTPVEKRLLVGKFGLLYRT